MKVIKLVNWDKYQHYKDRNPPWIKLYRDIHRNYEFSNLPDASKLLAFCLMPIAADQNNRIPHDLNWLKKEAGIKGKIDLKPLQVIGFIEVEQDASNVLADCKQDAMPETEERRGETETDIYKTFDDFWSAYPKKVGKEKAKSVWRTKNLDEIGSIILEHVIERAESDKQWLSDRQFIPHPTTFLNRGGWTDEYDKVAPKLRVAAI